MIVYYKSYMREYKIYLCYIKKWKVIGLDLILVKDLEHYIITNKIIKKLISKLINKIINKI